MIDDNEARATNPLAALRIARKLAVTVIGVSVLMFGLALIVLPGPAFIVIPMGLSILATEYLWARRLLRHVKARATQVLGQFRRLQSEFAAE
jgi:tellurite resistance protein TerC